MRCMKLRQARKNFSCRTATAALGLLLGLVPSLRGTDVLGPPGPATRPADLAPDAIAATIKTWFSDLANPDAAIRSDALTKLMCLESGDLPILKKVVEESRPLVPAQASVLRQIVTQVFLSGENYEAHAEVGFLGVRMEQTSVSFRDILSGTESLPSVGVIIVERMPGFAGARMLRDGDVVLSIVDRPNTPVTDPDSFATLIRSLGSGTAVQFQILRQGQVIRVAVKLDPRPIEADQGFGISELLERRRERVEEYWTAHFAVLVKEGVS